METEHTFIFLGYFAAGTTEAIEINMTASRPCRRADAMPTALAQAQQHAKAHGMTRLQLLDAEGTRTEELRAILAEGAN